MDREALRAVIGKRRSLEILELLEYETTLNYSDVENRVDTSSDVIVDRLERLCEYELVERREETPRDVRYSITDRGEEFLNRVRAVDALLTR